MWDFSWIERRWPGAGYEDWDRALDGLVERGYNAVRIDAFPHLVAREAEREWDLRPCWNQQTWGSPARNRVRIQPELNTFLAKCRDRGVLVELSSWFQRDAEESWRRLCTPARFAEAWKVTLGSVRAGGLLDAVFAVDLCNEWPFQCWAPFFNLKDDIRWRDAESRRWMRESVETLRSDFPELDFTFSHVGRLNLAADELVDLPPLDYLDPHVWMIHANGDEFYRRVDYNYERFDPVGYERVVDRAETLYRADPGYWNGLQRDWIDGIAEESRQTGLPLMTTEGWGIVDYKDWPLLDWEWVKESCAHGVRHAVSTGRWAAVCTSNFCGPQFVGMWRDVGWHQELCQTIRGASRDDADFAAKERKDHKEVTGNAVV